MTKTAKIIFWIAIGSLFVFGAIMAAVANAWGPMMICNVGVLISGFAAVKEVTKE